jgi:osmotically-inducible protein OsmY
MTSERGLESYDETVRHRTQRPFDHNEWALLQRVTYVLDLDPALDLSDVDVAIEGGDVILTGTVPGRATKTRLESTVARIDGVACVDNHLVVGGSRGR